MKGKIRCPLRPRSMKLPYEHPTVMSPPEHPSTCCSQQTITVAPTINAKSAQKHDYPSKAFRDSYARRSASERTFSQLYDPASNDISRGWCRLMGLTPNTLLLSCSPARSSSPTSASQTPSQPAKPPTSGAPPAGSRHEHAADTEPRSTNPPPTPTRHQPDTALPTTHTKPRGTSEHNHALGPPETPSGRAAILLKDAQMTRRQAHRHPKKPKPRRDTRRQSQT
ncbi:MAG: hypothetical protein ACRDK4_12140 [Solirubrobacteraceae bacterium]